MNKRSFLIGMLLLALAAPVHAQFFYFGRNKVQYTDFDWHVLRTDHFDIYYYREMKDLAERGAYFAEEAFRLNEEKFHHSLNQRVPLVFYSSHLHFQQTNTTGGFIPEGVGGFFEFLKGRVVIPSDGSLAQFRHVIRHELVHVFMHSKITRVLQDHRKAQDRYPPLWFVEGLAEFWSTEWDAQAEMVMRDAVLNRFVVGLDDMDRIYGSFLMYKEGQNALTYLARTYGEEKVRLLMENFWKEATFSDLLKITIGKDYKEFDNEWLYALQKQYYPLLADRDAPSHAAKLLVREGFNSKPVVFRKDSTTEVYFVANRTGYTGIFKRPLGGDDPHPDVEEVIEGERSDDFESFHLFRSRIDISRRGILAFVTKSGENDVLHLYDVESEHMVTTFRFASIVGVSSPSWGPDGRRLVFAGLDKGGNSDLYLLDTESRELTRLTNDYYDDHDPAWSPRGDVIAFSSDRTPAGKDGAYNLFLYTLRTGAIDYLTYGDQMDASPAWSPDARSLVFTSDLDGVANIWMMQMEKRDSLHLPSMVKLTRFLTSAFDPTFTPDGGLVFSSFEDFSFRLQMIPQVRAVADTSTTVRIVDIYNKEKPWEPKSVAGNTAVHRFRYEGEYSLDIAQSAVSTDPVFGTTGGAFVALSDVLGDDQYHFLIYNTAQTQDELLSSFNVAVSRVSLQKRTSYAYGIYRFAGRRYDLTVQDEFYYERVFGGYLALSYPLSRFERVEATTSLSNSSRELDFAVEPRRALLLSNALSFVHDNSLWSPTGPIDGSRFSLTLAYTSDVQYSNVNYYSVIADYRNYLRLSLRSALATRLWLFYNDGRESRRFVMGGSWDLRGWPRWSIRGQKLWLASTELRFPFLDAVDIQFPFGRIDFSAFRGALFFDTGGAWDEVYGETLGSLGGGVRLNLWGVLVLRYDIGKRIEQNMTKLQKGLFYQFFFGWDF